MNTFLECMSDAYKSGGLYCGGVVSEQSKRGFVPVYGKWSTHTDETDRKKGVEYYDTLNIYSQR